MSQLAQLPVGWNFRPDLERQYKGHVLARAPSLLSDSQVMKIGSKLEILLEILGEITQICMTVRNFFTI